MTHKIQEIIFYFFSINFFPKSFNDMTLETRKSITSLENLLVCGHSHTPEYRPEINFLNLGFFNFGYANHLTIEDDGSWQFHTEKYR